MDRWTKTHLDLQNGQWHSSKTGSAGRLPMVPPFINLFEYGCSWFVTLDQKWIRRVKEKPKWQKFSAKLLDLIFWPKAEYCNLHSKFSWFQKAANKMLASGTRRRQESERNISLCSSAHCLNPNYARNPLINIQNCENLYPFSINTSTILPFSINASPNPDLIKWQWPTKSGS